MFTVAVFKVLRSFIFSFSIGDAQRSQMSGFCTVPLKNQLVIKQCGHEWRKPWYYLCCTNQFNMTLLCLNVNSTKGMHRCLQSAVRQRRMHLDLTVCISLKVPSPRQWISCLDELSYLQSKTLAFSLFFDIFWLSLDEYEFDCNEDKEATPFSIFLYAELEA